MRQQRRAAGADPARRARQHRRAADGERRGVPGGRPDPARAERTWPRHLASAELDGGAGRRILRDHRRGPDGSAKPVIHWVAWNVSADTTRLPAGLQERDRLSSGPLEGIMQGATGRGTVGWYGPRPPKGDRPHHYHFQVLALDRQLALAPGATRDQVLAAAAGHVLATGDLVRTYAGAERP
jgi:Raf kinase inhibitor-like YbhB/YbcL family protein